MKKIQISESQFRKLVREEGEKIKKEIILRTKLSKIDQELAKLNEVHAGGEMSSGPDGVHAGQKKPVFTKKGTHLIEDEEEGMENMGSEEIGAEDMGSEEVGMESPEQEGEETLSKAAVMDAIRDLGNRLDLIGNVEFTGDGDELEIETGEETPGEEVAGGLDVDVESGAEEASQEVPSIEVSSDETGGEEEKEEVEECNTEMKQEVVQEAAKAPEKVKLTEEVSRMKFLAGLR